MIYILLDDILRKKAKILHGTPASTRKYAIHQKAYCGIMGKPFIQITRYKNTWRKRISIS